LTRFVTRSESGFTLVEILVAVALVGLLSTLIVGGVRLGAQAWTKAGRRSAGAADIDAVQDLVRHTIASAYPAFASSDPTDRSVAFNGDHASLALVAPLPVAIEAGVWARERFFVAQHGGAPALFMGWHLDLPASDEGTPLPENTVLLLEHVRAAHFGYFGLSEDMQNRVWQESWTGRRFLPEMVRVRIERDNPLLASWPELVAEPRATADPACRYDPVDVGCRRMR
jgi:general secretion pathway protein J